MTEGPGVRSRLVRELREVGRVTLYFLVCFGLVGSLKKLLLAEYDIRFTAAGAAVIGALVVAKVVILLDHTSAGERFRGGRVLSHVVYKAIAYTLAVTLVVAAEHFHHAYRTAGSWAGGWSEFTTLGQVCHMLFTAICVFLIFCAYNLYEEVDRRLGGGGALRAFLMSRWDDASE